MVNRLTTTHHLGFREKHLSHVYRRRWIRKGVKNADGDHVLQHQSKSGAPFTLDEPAPS